MYYIRIERTKRTKGLNMEKTKLKKLLWGSVMTGMLMGAPSCSSRDSESDDSEDAQTELVIPRSNETIREYNNELFNKTRSKIKFSLAFVENYYPHIYTDGKVWTTGHGLTVLYQRDGTSLSVTKNTPVPSLDESDVFKGRYLTREILSDVKDLIKVPLDENTLLATCAFRYCVGHNGFKKSEFLRQLNSGKKGADLAKYLTGFRQQHGVINRMYFFAALMAGQITYTDLLDLRAEGCYNLTDKDMLVYSGNTLKKDSNGFYEWDFSKIMDNLKKAKQARTVYLRVWDNTIGKVKTVSHNCKLVKEIVPDYIWKEVSDSKSVSSEVNESKDTEKQRIKRVKADKAERNAKKSKNADVQNDISYLAYQECDYEEALKAGKRALKHSVSNKQYGASYYNVGVVYSAMGKHNKAVKNLELSLSFNETKEAREALNIAKHKQKNRRNKMLLYGGISAGAIAASAVGVVAIRRKYLLQQKQNKRQR